MVNFLARCANYPLDNYLTGIQIFYNFIQNMEIINPYYRNPIDIKDTTVYVSAVKEFSEMLNGYNVFRSV